MHDRYRRVPMDGKFFLSKHISEPVIQAHGRFSAEFVLKLRKGLATMRPTVLAGSLWALYWSAEYIDTLASRCTFERFMFDQLWKHGFAESMHDRHAIPSHR